MLPSELPESGSRPIDWRGWVILAWVLWFGVLYAKMVVEQRGQKFREVVATSKPR